MAGRRPAQVREIEPQIPVARQVLAKATEQRLALGERDLVVSDQQAVKAVGRSFLQIAHSASGWFGLPSVLFGGRVLQPNTVPGILGFRRTDSQVHVRMPFLLVS